MGVQFRELVSWVRHRKIFASVLVALTLGIGIMIGTLIPGKVAARRPAAEKNGVALLSIPDPVSLSNGFSLEIIDLLYFNDDSYKQSI